MGNTSRQGSEMKKELLKDFKSNLHLKVCWSVEEFSVLTGYSPAYIKEQMDSGELKKFQPRGRETPKITEEAMQEWFQRNSFFDSTELMLINKAEER